VKVGGCCCSEKAAGDCSGNVIEKLLGLKLKRSQAGRDISTLEGQAPIC
jgi:hypothetical protein